MLTPQYILGLDSEISVDLFAGAGGSDCIHTADYWLQQRGYNAYAEEHY